jgi:hypothetical protein
MNQRDKKAFIKRELAALENEELLFQQCLSSITSRKRYLESELDSLGASNSTRKGKYENVLSEEIKFKLQASLTK